MQNLTKTPKNIEIFDDTGFGYDCFNDTKAQATKEKIDKLDYIKKLKLLCIKGQSAE